jgi:hypothetical protein
MLMQSSRVTGALPACAASDLEWTSAVAPATTLTFKKSLRFSPVFFIDIPPSMKFSIWIRAFCLGGSGDSAKGLQPFEAALGQVSIQYHSFVTKK